MTIGLQAYLQGYMHEKQAVEPTSEDAVVNDPARLERILPAPPKINLKDILPGGAATKGGVSSTRDPDIDFAASSSGASRHGGWVYKMPDPERERKELIQARIAKIFRDSKHMHSARPRGGNLPPSGQNWRSPPGTVWTDLVDPPTTDVGASMYGHDWKHPGVSNYNTDFFGERGKRSPLPIQHSLEKLLRGQGGKVDTGVIPR